MTPGTPKAARRIACVRVPNLAIQAYYANDFARQSVKVSPSLSPLRGLTQSLRDNPKSSRSVRLRAIVEYVLAVALPQRGGMPWVVAIPHDPDQALEALSALADALSRFGPLVSLCHLMRC